MAYELRIRPEQYDPEDSRTYLELSFFIMAVGRTPGCRMAEGFEESRYPAAEVNFPAKHPVQRATGMMARLMDCGIEGDDGELYEW